MFTKVRLYSSEFGFVHQGWLPKFNEPPQILLWGQRMFKYHFNGIYLEVFAVVLVPIPNEDQLEMFVDKK